jgi:hypothetical protein
MKRIALVMVLMAAAVLGGAPNALADPLPETALPDWRELLEELSGDGDHVVGEELCARPSYGHHMSD